MPEASKTLTVDLGALYAELVHVVPDDGGALTMSEIMDRTGKSVTLAKRLVGKAQELGLCKPTRVKRRDLTGVMRSVPAYIFEPGEDS